MIGWAGIVSSNALASTAVDPTGLTPVLMPVATPVSAPTGPSVGVSIGDFPPGSFVSESAGPWAAIAVNGAVAIALGAVFAWLGYSARRRWGDRHVDSEQTIRDRRVRFIEQERQIWRKMAGHGLESEAVRYVPPPTGKTVLVADDDAEVTKWLALRLRQLGVATIRSPDAMHALLGTHRAHPDLLILDLCMPAGSGLAVCELLASDPQRAGIPVIIYTGASDDMIRRRIEQLGAHWVQKSPDAWPKLRALTCRLLDIPEPSAAQEAEMEIPEEPARPLADSPPPSPRFLEHLGESHAKSEPTTTPPSETSTPPTRPESLPPVPPTASAAPAAAPAKAHANPPTPPPRLDILPSIPTFIRTGPPRVVAVLDDSRASHGLIEHMNKAGFDVVTAEDVENGYMACYSKKPSLIVLDAGIGGHDTKTAVLRFREHLFLRDAMIVVLVKQNDPALETQLAPYGTCRCFVKPSDSEQLVAELARRLGYSKPASDAEEAEPEPEHHASHPRPASHEDAASILVPGLSREHEPEAQRRPTILVIDDDPNVSRSIAARLRPYGVDVLRAFSGMQGYWMGLDARPDVIICDLRMPDGEGNYIFTRFKQHPLTKDTPVIILTGYANPGHKREMLAAGVTNYFTKPWDFHELMAELRHHIPIPTAALDGSPLAADPPLEPVAPGPIA